MAKRLFLLLSLFAASLAWARDKAENWVEVRSPHFVVLSNSSEKQARHVADQFERMRLFFHAEVPRANVDPSTPIVVLALKDKKDIQSLEPEAYLAKGQIELAGLFMRAPDKNYVLLRLDAQGEHPYATVYHEYEHLLCSGAAEWLPLWLNEGLAEFYENTEIRNKEVVWGEPSQGNVLLLRRERLLPLPILFRVDQNSPYYHEEIKGSIFYAESWALTHYLQMKDRQQHTERLHEYAELVSQKVDPVTAGTRAFGDLNQLQAALEKYVAQTTFFVFKGPISTEVDETAFKVQSISPAQADASRADFLAYEQRVKDAKTLLERVLQEDPSNASAHETMGYLEVRQGHLEEARKWYAQAIKLDSQSFLAYYYFAAITMNAAGLDSQTRPQVESSLRTAIKLNPSFAPPYEQLAVLYGMQRENLEEAHTLILTAVQLDPGNLRYRLNTADILLEMGRSTDAIAVLTNAMSLAKTPDQVVSVQNLLESARQYQPARVQEQPQSAPAIQSAASQGPPSAQETPASAEQKQRSSTSNSAPQDPGAYGPIDILSDTKGVDFHSYLQPVLKLIQQNWYSLVPESARSPIMKKGKVTITFRVMKDGKIADVQLRQSSGDVALDRAAYVGVTRSDPLPPLPRGFVCQYLALQFRFYYNPAQGDVGPEKADARMPCVTTAIHMIGDVQFRVTPSSQEVVTGAKQQFSAIVNGETNPGVNWKVSGPNCLESVCGSISPDGVYTAPYSIPNPPSILVTATLAADAGQTASATVTVVQPPTH